ncbi:MAG: hypothetical protein KAS97_07550 [Candidatus Aminicenantes bacterium]|nr:hypothetical protein [Candidatus Aminicenantes bacterium]
MGNVYLVLAFFSSLSIVLLLRIFENRGFDRYVIIASNYLISGSIGFLFLTGKEFPNTEMLIFGAVIGLLFFISFSAFSLSLKKYGIASTVTFGRLSLAIPVIASILLWGESPSFTNAISIFLIFLIIILWGGKIRNISPLLILLFFLFGVIDASMKYFKIRFPLVDNNMFLITLFFSAFIWSWIYILVSGRRVKRAAVLSGFTLGIPNFFSSYFVLQALSNGIPAFVTFPFINIGVIISSAILGKILFKEQLSPKRIFLIILGITAIVFLSS